MVYPLLLILVLLLALWRGWHKGMMYQLASLLGLAFGFVSARIFCDGMAELIDPYFPAAIRFADEPFGTPLRHYALVTTSATIVFLLVYWAFKMLGGVLTSAMQFIHTGAINSILGAAFNFIKWTLIMSVLFNMWLAMHPDSGLMKYCNDGDGNVVELVMSAAPALFGTEGSYELEHTRRLQQAKQIEQQ